MDGIGWISVKDRLPQASKRVDSDKYLILLHGKFPAISQYMKGFKSHWEECKVDNFRVIDNKGIPSVFNNVTHWMPIPKLP